MVKDINNWGVAHALRLLIDHMSRRRLDDLCRTHSQASDAEFRRELIERFGKVRSKAVPALDQIRRITELAKKNGYTDVLTLLNEPLCLDIIPTDPQTWDD